MRTLSIIGVVTLLTAVSSGLAPVAKANAWDQLTKVTFSQPIEIPGQVLPAGTYWFKLMDSPSERNIVQIYNADQSKQIGMIMAIPDYRLKPSDKTVITFEERRAGSPQALRAWFYPGDNYGQEFVYPRQRAVELAKTVNQPVLSMPANLEANTKIPSKSGTEAPAIALKNAPVTAQQPSGKETELGAVVTTPPQLVAKNNPPPQPPSPVTALPRTASDLPLIGLIGLGFLAGGLLTHILARRLT